MRAHVRRVLGLAVLLAVAAGPVRGMVSVSDFPHVVQHADVIVRAKVIRWDEVPWPEASDEALFRKKEGLKPVARVQVLEVRKVLAGQCAERIVMEPFWRDSLQPGQEAYLCLRRSPRLPGAYEAMNLGLLALPVLEDGRVAVPKRVHYPDGAERLLEPDSVETAENVEAALRYYRGPDMDVRPLKDAFAVDEPLALDVTLTNRTSRPMALALDRGRALRIRFGLGLWDGQGRSVLISQTLVTRELMMDDSEFEPLRETVRLDVGESVRRTVEFPLPPAQFAFSPERARTATLTYRSRAQEGEWYGGQFAECPVRLRCADGAWMDTLAQPTDGLAVTLHVYSVWGPARSTVGTPRDVWMEAMFARPEPGPILRSRMTGGFSYSPLDVPPAARAALAARLDVRLGDRVLARPALAPGGLETLLAPVRPGQDARVQHWNLAETVDFSEPGLYRVRLVVPDGDAAARSNEVLVHIPRAEGDAPKEAP
ncbi:MAG: hypothetical protein ISS74_08620 [Planctomycetes bacterium]|nr:hypothetical protein [Planctomycetota bacterium]